MQSIADSYCPHLPIDLIGIGKVIWNTIIATSTQSILRLHLRWRGHHTTRHTLWESLWWWGREPTLRVVHLHIGRWRRRYHPHHRHPLWHHRLLRREPRRRSRLSQHARKLTLIRSLESGHGGSCSEAHRCRRWSGSHG